MTNKKQQTEKKRHAAKKQKVSTIIEEVESIEDLALRMQELVLTEPEGTRIYLRVRNSRTIH